MDPTLLAILGIVLPILLVIFRDKPIIKSIIIAVAKMLNIKLSDSYTGADKYELEEYVATWKEFRDMCKDKEILAKMDEIYPLLRKETPDA